MKTKILLTLLLSLQLLAAPQLDLSKLINEKNLKGEDETNQSSLLLLYQLALKNRKENLFGKKDLCIDYDKSGNNKYKLSIVVNAEAYEVGAASYNYSSAEHKEKYDKLGKVLNILDSFFKASGTSPQVTVNAFADGVNNRQQKYASQAQSLLNSKDSNFNTVSKASNHLLAKDRGQNFSAQKFFPASWKHRKIAPYHSPAAEEKLSKEQKNCDPRRSVVLDLEYSPYMKFSHSAGTFSPVFNTVTANESEQLQHAAFSDAIGILSDSNGIDDALKKMPVKCQNFSTKRTLERINKLFGEFKAKLYAPTIVPKVAKDLITKKHQLPQINNNRITLELYKISKRIQDLEAKNQDPALQEKLKKYESYIVSILKHPEEKKKIFTNKDELFSLLNSSDARPIGNIYTPGLFNRFALELKRKSFPGVSRSSTHGLDCFKTDSFFNHTAKNNPTKLLSSVDKYIDQNGKFKIKLTKDNLPYDSKVGAHGFFCNQCHSGIHFHNGKEHFTSREGLQKKQVNKNYSSEALNDSKVTQNFFKSKAKESSYFGSHKSLFIQIIPGCKKSADGNGFDKDYVDKVARKISINKIPFEVDLNDISPEDCIYTPPIMTACTVEPKGEGDKSPHQEPKKMVEYFNLDKMKVEKLLLDDNLSLMENLAKNLGTLGVKCSEGGNTSDDHPSAQDLINELKCDNRGIKRPKLDLNSIKECQEE